MSLLKKQEGIKMKKEAKSVLKEDIERAISRVMHPEIDVRAKMNLLVTSSPLLCQK